MEVHETEDTGSAGPVSSHKTVDEDRLTESEGGLYKLEHGTNKQGQVLHTVRCVQPPETDIEGVVTEIQKVVKTSLKIC